MLRLATAIAAAFVIPAAAFAHPGEHHGGFASLVHLVRNAIDHGLETPAERAASGKQDAVLSLRASIDALSKPAYAPLSLNATSTAATSRLAMPRCAARI